MECSTFQQNITTLYRIYKMENFDKLLSVCLRGVGWMGSSGFLWVNSISVMNNFIPTLTPVPGSIIFGPQFLSFFNQWVLWNKEYVFRFTDIQPTLFCFCVANGLIPQCLEWELSIEKLFTISFPKKQSPGGFVSEMNLRSTSFTQLNFPDEITKMTSKDEENEEICPFLKTREQNFLGIWIQTWSTGVR